MVKANVVALAKLLHESGREAVMAGKVVNKSPGQPFYEWDFLTPDAQEGRILMARFLVRRKKALLKLLA